jgi:hypothetical protein
MREVRSLVLSFRPSDLVAKRFEVSGLAAWWPSTVKLPAEGRKVSDRATKRCENVDLAAWRPIGMKLAAGQPSGVKLAAGRPSGVKLVARDDKYRS